MKRTTRALSPTEMGSTFFQEIKRILVEFDNVNASIANAADRLTGRLRLAAPTTFGTTELLPGLLEFAKQHPAIDLDVDLSDRAVNLIDEGFDAAIRIGKPADSSLVTRKLCTIKIVLAASPSYLRERGVPGTPDDLVRHECIIDTNFKDADSWHFKIREEATAKAFGVKGRFRLSNAEACLAAAKAGLGIARLPSFVAGPSLSEGSLVPVLCEFEDEPSSLLALYPPARVLAPKVRALIDFLSIRYRGVPHWDQRWRVGL